MIIHFVVMMQETLIHDLNRMKLMRKLRLFKGLYCSLSALHVRLVVSYVD